MVAFIVIISAWILLGVITQVTVNMIKGHYARKGGVNYTWYDEVKDR